MKLDEIIHSRRSVRKFKSQPIEPDIIESIIESARLAPSAVNFQPWKFYVCASEEAKDVYKRQALIIGAMKAKLLPRKIGTIPFVTR